jgi:non-heme chloroperoxidase
MSFEAKSVEARDGVRLEYVEQGDPAGVPLILLHGVTDSWRSFERVLPHLPRSIRAIALTQRGHGGSDKPRDGYATRDFASDVAAAADALGIARFVVAGHSMGTVNSLRVAIDFPDRVLGVVLAAAFATFRDNPVVRDYWETCVSMLTDPIDPAVAKDFQASTLEHPVPHDFFEMVCAESLRVPARVWRAAFEGMFEEDFVADLHRVSAPTLILHASRDAFCRPEDPDALLSAIPGSRMALYKGAGHALHWEEPARFAGDLAAFTLSAAGTAMPA